MAHGQDNAEIGIDHGPTLTCIHEAPIVAHSLRGEGFDASEDGTGRGTPLAPVAYGLTTEQTPHFSEECALTLTKQSPTGGGQPQAVAFDANAGGNTALATGDVPGALHGVGRTALAFDLTQITSVANRSIPQPVSPTMASASNLHAFTPWTVRRLTPRECERLQGFPDDYTLVPYRRGMSADGTRHKALGNSMAVNVMEWIGARIAMAESLP